MRDNGQVGEAGLLGDQVFFPAGDGGEAGGGETGAAGKPPMKAPKRGAARSAMVAAIERKARNLQEPTRRWAGPE